MLTIRLITLLLITTASSAMADDDMEVCTASALEQATSPKFVPTPSRYVHPIDSSNIVFRCDNMPGLPAPFVHAHRATADATWQVTAMGKFGCPELKAINNGLELKHEACPGYSYHGPESCSYTTEQWVLRKGRLEKSDTKTTIRDEYREACVFCSGKEFCNMDTVRKEAARLHKAGKSSEAYRLLKTYYHWYIEGYLMHSAAYPGDVDPWFVSDLLLVAARSGESCAYARELERRIDKKDAKVYAAIEHNKKLCTK